MIKFLALPLVGAVNLVESFVDNVIRDKVQPVIGSILYCDLAFGLADHSGIYVGNNEIIHLSGTGEIEKVSTASFMYRLNGNNSARSIYVSCRGTDAVGDESAAFSAESMLGSTREYNLILNNCHQFTSGCITGNFENTDSFLMFLKLTAKEELKADSWRVWDTWA